jgi:hypothetical protein
LKKKKGFLLDKLEGANQNSTSQQEYDKCAVKGKDTPAI